jgi:hypothetical protein
MGSRRTPFCPPALAAISDRENPDFVAHDHASGSSRSAWSSSGFGIASSSISASAARSRACQSIPSSFHAVSAAMKTHEALALGRHGRARPRP